MVQVPTGSVRFKELARTGGIPSEKAVVITGGVRLCAEELPVLLMTVMVRYWVSVDLMVVVVVGSPGGGALLNCQLSVNEAIGEVRTLEGRKERHWWGLL